MNKQVWSTDTRNCTTQRKTCPSTTLSPTNPTSTGLGLELWGQARN